MKFNILFVFAICMAFISCNSSTVNKGPNQSEAVESPEEFIFYNDLGDYLRRVPGLQFNDGYFRIRGPQSLTQTTEPLYVIDGVMIGNSFSRANGLIDANNIARVNVLKSVDSTSQYGMRGSSGVIEIFTKKTDRE